PTVRSRTPCGLCYHIFNRRLWRRVMPPDRSRRLLKMKTIRWFPVVLALTACGGGLTTDDYRANALTFDKVAIAQNDGDTAAPTNADGSVTYDFELDIKSTGAFVKVASGSLTHTGPAAADVTDAGANVRVENKGNASFDFDALASVVTTEKARGQISDAFDNV